MGKAEMEYRQALAFTKRATNPHFHRLTLRITLERYRKWKKIENNLFNILSVKKKRRLMIELQDCKPRYK